MLLLAALAGAWEVFATQAPGSALYVGVVPGPVQALRETALWLGLLIFAAGRLMPELDATSAPKTLVPALHLGCVLTLGAGTYAAFTGMHGAQLFDLRPDAAPLFLVKHLGLLVVSAALIETARRALWARRAS